MEAMKKRPTLSILLSLFLILAVNSAPFASAGAQRRAKAKPARTKAKPPAKPSSKRSARPAPSKQSAPASDATAELLESLREIIGRPEFTTALVGVNIVKEQSGEVLFQHEAGKMMMPASNMKVYTTA